MRQIQKALVSVYHKDGLEKIAKLLLKHQIQVYSTGGTQSFLEGVGLKVHSVEDLTGYPSILDGRVKTLHPKVFGGLLARSDIAHEAQLSEYNIPRFDLVVVDLYPFEETVANSTDMDTIIEKIDIGGISLIRAAAKNFQDVVVIPSKSQYANLENILSQSSPSTDLETRKSLALEAFRVSSHYDTAIAKYFEGRAIISDLLSINIGPSSPLRYGENPHQTANFYGSLEREFEKLGGKEISFNNLVDIDAAIELMREFKDDKVCFAILKHTNVCGISIRSTTQEAYLAALQGDPISAFGGILICNHEIDLQTAQDIDKQFYEVLIAPSYSEEAKTMLLKKKNRILLKRTNDTYSSKRLKTVLSGVVVQDADLLTATKADLTIRSDKKVSEKEIGQLLFANKIAKHLKSNTIVLANNFQLLGMGCGQTSRIDACKQAIDKAIRMGFELKGAVLASDAFFPFPDCVEIAHKAGIEAFIQPGGSMNDQLSIDYCDQNGLSIVFTGKRHFKH